MLHDDYTNLVKQENMTRLAANTYSDEMKEEVFTSSAESHSEKKPENPTNSQESGSEDFEQKDPPESPISLLENSLIHSESSNENPDERYMMSGGLQEHEQVEDQARETSEQVTAQRINAEDNTGNIREERDAEE
jgi:hypothetical protein